MPVIRTIGLFLLLAAEPLSAAPLAFYVATNGNDRWSGTLASPNGSGTDGPKATLPAALHTARLVLVAGVVPAINILVRHGTHMLAEPLTLTPEHSGQDATRPLTIANSPGERPVLSGGRVLTGWKPVPGKPGHWQAEVPEARDGRWDFRSLFVNGRRAVRARTPNAGAWFSMKGERFGDKPAQFHFRTGDLDPAWAAEPDAELVGYEKWISFRQRIREINTVSNVVVLSGNAAPHTHEGGARYYVENLPGALDAPGEWRLDRSRGVVTYIAQTGEDVRAAVIVAPRLEDLVRFRGDSAGRKPVRHVVLRGLTFAHTDWSMPEAGYTDTQAAVAIRGDLSAEGATDCGIEDCTFAHLGGYAVDFGRGCQRNRVVGCEAFDVGAGGIRLGEPGDRDPDAFAANHSHQITDNHLHGLGVIYAPAVGVLILQSGTNRVAHNHIHDLYYTAVSVGWNWGYRETPCRANVVEFNHLHDVGQDLLSDMGAVYTLGIQRGTVIRNNLIHDVSAFTYGGWGLYPDEGSTDIVWENNVVYRCKSAGFHQHYGRDNVVRNNIFAFNREHQLMRTREEAHLSFVFTNNIVLYNSGALLGSNWKNEKFVTDGNVYFDARSRTNPAVSIRFAGASLAQWQQRGHDAHSVVADPLFVDAEKFDFRLRPESPALKMGFVPLDVSRVGVRPPPDRR